DGDLERDAVECVHDATLGREPRLQLADLQQRLTLAIDLLREAGSRRLTAHLTLPPTRRRSSSPIRRRAITVISSVAAGTKTSAGDSARCCRPSLIIPPQLGCGGGMPNPRKLSEPSATITVAA